MYFFVQITTVVCNVILPERAHDCKIKSSILFQYYPFQKSVEIPIGTTCAPLLEDILYTLKWKTFNPNIPITKGGQVGRVL